MALFDQDIVLLACTCGTLRPISRLYYCRHCQEIRCSYCVCHEVESHYCSGCLENLPSSEARMKKYKCQNCTKCPSCFNTLVPRVVSSSIPNPDDPKKVVTKKVYYLTCFVCQWSTRDANIPDQNTASGCWNFNENPYAERVNSLMEYYRAVSTRDRQLKEKKKYNPKRSYAHYTDKLGMFVMARKRAAMSYGSSTHEPALPDLDRYEASEDVPQLDEDIFTKPVNLQEVSTLEQRLARPESQSEYIKDLLPKQKSLLIKRSQRCRSCEHNVSKPEYSPSSTKFKIQLFALFHIPEVRIVTCEPLRPGQNSQLIIRLCNPTQHQTTVSFLPLPTVEEEEQRINKILEDKKKSADKKDEKAAGGEDLSVHLSSLTRQMCITEDPQPVTLRVTSDIELPTTSVILPARDDAAEYDDSTETQNYSDDPRVVMCRKGNKVTIKMAVTPHSSLIPGQDVYTGFVLQYIYVNTVSPLVDQKATQNINLQAKVYLKIGKTF